MVKKIQEGGFFRRAAVMALAVVLGAGVSVFAAAPVAVDDTFAVTDFNGTNIDLLATGSPTDYIITSLPEHGWLYDAVSSLEITEDDLPYTLLNGDFIVTYVPCQYFVAGETFTFQAENNDGPSNIATISLVLDTFYEVQPEAFADYIPLDTFYKKSRSQLIYHAAELGDRALTITNLALSIETVPTIPVENWTIRMKHTTLDQYPPNAEFDNTGWTPVYTNPSETITSTGWVEFAFQAPFAYNGTDNLMIDFSFNSTNFDDSGYAYFSNIAEDRILSWSDDSGDPLTVIVPDFQETGLFNLKLQGDAPRFYGDFDCDYQVNMDDLMTMIDTWLASDGAANYNPACDISIVVDNKVDLADFAVLAPEWLGSMD